MGDSTITKVERIIRKANRIAWAITPPPPKLAMMYRSISARSAELAAIRAEQGEEA
jgi:Txe/YoeB family toxin of Txe-Axe toxin-antitoxin module